jgi:hypothetical protein
MYWQTFVVSLKSIIVTQGAAWFTTVRLTGRQSLRSFKPNWWWKRSPLPLVAGFEDISWHPVDLAKIWTSTWILNDLPDLPSLSLPVSVCLPTQLLIAFIESIWYKLVWGLLAVHKWRGMNPQPVWYVVYHNRIQWFVFKENCHQFWYYLTNECDNCWM